MITTHITLADKYRFLEAKFAKGLAFLTRTDLVALPAGTPVVIDEAEGIVAHVNAYETEPAHTRRFETHDAHFDIQFLVQGEERFDVAPRALLVPDGAHDSAKDCAFYKEPDVYSTLILRPGDFAIVSPEEAHKPCCAVNAPMRVKKIVVKIRI